MQRINNKKREHGNSNSSIIFRKLYRFNNSKISFDALHFIH